MLLAYLVAVTLQPDAPATAPDEEEIIVEGHRLTDPKQALKIVKDITQSSQSQLARFFEPVCPFVTGLAPEAEAVVRNRIRTAAKEVGAPVAPEKCQSNLIVAVTNDGGGVVKELLGSDPRWFNGMARNEIDRLLKEGPIRAWSIVNLRDETGLMPNPDVSVRGTSVPDVLGESGIRAMGSGVPHTRVRDASIFGNASKYYLDGTVIVIDSSAVEGLTLRQIGDYAAMRGLARVRPPTNPRSLNTILNLFSPPRETAPRRLTRFDERYLIALYKGKGTEKAVQEQNRIARLMVDNKEQ